MTQRASLIDWRKRFRLIFGLAYVALLVLAALFLLPDYWYLWLLMVLVVLSRFISWTSKKKKYKCTKCGTEFIQEKKRFSLTPKAADLYDREKAPKCPKCGSVNIKTIEEKK
jgi:DNA-directed RNA polymerase subunit RPC12/RpoP